ncbi:MAG: hypothetical protein ABIR78_13840 [Ferruginibacter sp.]
MKIFKGRFIFLLFLLSGISTYDTHAQDLNISGDTIYVNAEAEIMVRFPTLPTFWNTVPSNAPYNFKTAGNGFTIIARTEKPKPSPAPLFVNEGGRTHKFIIVFKKNIDYNNDAEMDYDYSTTKKLEQHIRDVAIIRVTTKKSPEPVNEDPTKTKKSKKDKEEENTAVTYYVLLEEGDNYIKLKDYSAAKSSFEKAQKMRPADQIPKQRLEEIKLRMADTEKSVNEEKNKLYVDVIAKAKSSLNTKKYTKAQEEFKKALEIKPGDIYAKHELEKIDVLLSAQATKLDQDKLDDLYKGYMITGEKALKKNDLVEARVAFEQAIIIKQNDPVAGSKLKMISDKEKEEKAKVDAESSYTGTIENADKLFKAGDYDEAKTQYTKALGLGKKSWPQDQIKKIDKLQAAQLAKENADKQKRLKDSESELKIREKAKQESDYNEAIKAADKYFSAKDLANATIAYTKALSIDKRPWPADQLKAIQKLKDEEEAEKKKTAAREETAKQAKERKKQEEKEKDAREKEYKSLIKDADKAFKKNEFEAAKASYVKASTLSTEKWPLTQIAAIDKIFDAQRAKEAEDKLRLAKEAELTTQYNSVIDKAKVEFDKGNFVKARKLYSDAALIKPSEKLPAEKLREIQQKIDDIAAAEKAKKESIAAAAELKNKYVLAMSKARSYNLKGDLSNAKNAYSEASLLKPAEEEPKAQLKVIQAKLDILAKASEVDDKYDQKVSTADSLLILKSYESALAWYKDALKIKPSEYYPQTQINYINGEVKNQQKEKEDRAKLEAYQKEQEQDQKYRDALKQGKQAIADKKYDVAKAAYTEVLKIQPDHEYALHMLKVIEFQVGKENLAKAKKPDIKTTGDITPVVTEKKEPKIQQQPILDSALMKIVPIPYTAAELKAKYPDIDFAKLPPEQPFNAEAVNSLENATIFSTILLEEPRLNISTTESKIKLTCQAINFEGSSVYLKFLVQNNSKADFLTGAMMLTWTKKSGNRIKLYPIYLYPGFLPIITPGNEASIVYVFKSYYINDNEKLNFELSDRLNKIKLEIEIPGAKYNKEEDR